MPNQGFTIGKDVSLVINTSSGIQHFSLITKFNSTPVVGEQKVVGLDGIIRHVKFHEGWKGSFEIDRQDSNLDLYWAQVEDDYHSGRNQDVATITETIQETDGSVTQFRYEGVVPQLEDAGDKAGNKVVTQKLSFLASRRIAIA